MQPSSFVFVAILALWAAYLLPQWIRRREALGAARGQDRHSAGLRVLDRRRRANPAGPSSRPILTATAIVVAPAPGPSVPLPPPVAPGPAAPDGAVTGPARDRRPAPVGPVNGRPQVPAMSTAGDRAGGAVAARRRAVVLGALLALTVLVAAGALTGAVPGALVALPLALLALDVAALRAVALRERRRRAAVAARTALRRAQAPRRAAAVATTVEAPEAGPEPTGPVVPAAADEPARALPEEAVAFARPGESAVLVAGDGSWVPVPVPPPTYTLKPMAPRPEPAPLPVPPSHVEPVEPVVDEPQVDLDSVLERRRAVNG